jgi:hypothetical protein
MVQVLPDGREAIARGIELGMIGDAARGTQHWQINVFRNRFVKHDGVWKLMDLDVQPLLKADFAKGWGDASALIAGRTPEFISPGARSARGRPADAKVTLAEARRRLARSMAYDGTENVSAAYGYYIDDFQWPSMGAIFAVKGNKTTFMVTSAGTASVPRPPPCMAIRAARTGIAYHWHPARHPRPRMAARLTCTRLSPSLARPPSASRSSRACTQRPDGAGRGHLETVGPGDRRIISRWPAGGWMSVGPARIPASAAQSAGAAPASRHNPHRDG